MKFIFLISSLLFVLQTTGCASAPRSTLLGMTIGASVGGLVGNSQGDYRDQSTVTGLAVGAAAGALFGYLAHKGKKEPMPPIVAPSAKEFEIPPITRPRVNCSQVPDSIDGNKWIEKHRVCIIDSPSTWSR